MLEGLTNLKLDGKTDKLECEHGQRWGIDGRTDELNADG